MGKLVLSIIILSCFYSCGKTEDEEVRSAINQAKYYLSALKCSKAQDSLDEVDFQEDNADYISTYASAFACYAGYGEVDILFGDGGLTTIDPSNLFASLASFSTSNETTADSSNYAAINNAITTLLSFDNAAGTPSAIDRESKFGTKKAGDLSMQALYLLFVQLGKHFALYGNKGNDGSKGGDLEGFGNTCIYSYTTEDAVDYITAGSGSLGSCTAATGSEGSDFLEGITEALAKERLCRGIIYYNNLIDILSNTTLPASDLLGSIGDIGSTFTTLMNTAVAAETGVFNDGDTDGLNAISTLKDITSQTDCEAVTIERIEKFYAIFFETVYQ